MKNKFIYLQLRERAIKMTVKEIKSMIAGMKDDDKISFIRRDYDRDCFPVEWVEDRDIVKIVKMSVRGKPTTFGGYFYPINEEG